MKKQLNPSIKELLCSDCIFFRHSAIEANRAKNRCELKISQYRKERLAFGDDPIMCDNGRTECEDKILGKSW